MPKTKQQETSYPIEEELAKLVREIRLSLRKVVKFFFVIPKEKDEKMIHLMEISAWVLLTIALIFRIGRI